MTVEEMLARISSRELTEWMRYERVCGPLGAERDNLHAGLVAAAIYNVNRERGRKAFRPQDFLFEFEASEPSAEQTPQDLYGMFKTWAQAARPRSPSPVEAEPAPPPAMVPTTISEDMIIDVGL